MDNRTLAARLVLVLLLAPVLAAVACSALPGFESYVVLSGSMEPTIPSDSVVYVSETNEYEAGDVVTFVHEERVITHRIVGETRGGFVTKGDANGDADPWRIPRHAIIGEVVVAVPLYGYLLGALSSPLGYVATVVFPALLLLWRSVSDVLAELRGE